LRRRERSGSRLPKSRAAAQFLLTTAGTRVQPAAVAPSPITKAAQPKRRCRVLFLIVFIVLLLAWIFSWAIFHIAGGLLHLLLVIAIISLILHFVRGRTTTV
jgi:hypothetical protein